MENHYVYYSYEEFGRGYIGCRTCNCLPEEDDYLGSYHDETFSPTNKIVLETNAKTKNNENDLNINYLSGGWG